MRKILMADEDLGPVLKKKHEVLSRIFPEISNILERNDLEFCLTDEYDKVPGGLYEKYSDWAFAVFTPRGRKAKVMISNKAVETLSDLAFEGIIYMETARMLLYNEATRNSRLALRRMENMDPIERDVRVYASVDRFFNTKGLVPYKAEAANIEFHDGKADPGYYKDFLSKLGKVAPEDAAEILNRLEFKDKLL